MWLIEYKVFTSFGFRNAPPFYMAFFGAGANEVGFRVVHFPQSLSQRGSYMVILSG